MEGKLLFYYFGDDEAYFRAIVGEFKRHTKFVIDFQRYYESDEKKIQSLFLKVYKNKAACVFIDLSKNSQDYIHLARILARANMDHTPILVGLVDYLSPPEVLRESIITGINLAYIKSPETFDVVFGVSKLISPTEIAEHGFANADLKDDFEAGLPVKIGFIFESGLHIETDYPLKDGDQIRMNHHWTKKKVVPSREFFVKKVNARNLFYHFKNAADVEFHFVDQYLPPDGVAPKDIEERKEYRLQTIKHHKKMLANWLSTNTTLSLEKKAKVLIVDPEFHFYNDQPRTDKNAYTIRCIPFLRDINLELDRLEPQVIAYSLDRPESKEVKNTTEQLQILTKTLSERYQDKSPFVIVFNSKIPSKEVKETFNYSNIMTTESEISVELLVRMAEIFDKKLEKSSINSKSNIPRIYLRKTHNASIAEIVFNVTLTKLSETDLVFKSEAPIPIGSNLHFSSPIEMFVNVQPSKGQSKDPEFYGLIHAVGEEEKKQLRRFINTVFFRDHDAQLQAETDEYQKLNVAKKQEKEDAVKKAAEEAKKAAAGESESSSNQDKAAPKPPETQSTSDPAKATEAPPKSNT
jgi:hypothetical protein